MADYFFVGQTEGRVQATASVDITGATSRLIKYIKPNGVTGQWAAVASALTTGVVYYDIAQATTLDIAGDWKCWAWVTFSSGNSAPGKSFIMEVKEEGD